MIKWKSILLFLTYWLCISAGYSQTIKLSENNYYDTYPSIYKNSIVWTTSTYKTSGNIYINLFENDTVRQLTSSQGCSFDAEIGEKYVVWVNSLEDCNNIYDDNQIQAYDGLNILDIGARGANYNPGTEGDHIYWYRLNKAEPNSAQLMIAKSGVLVDSFVINSLFTRAEEYDLHSYEKRSSPFGLVHHTADKNGVNYILKYDFEKGILDTVLVAQNHVVYNAQYVEDEIIFQLYDKSTKLYCWINYSNSNFDTLSAWVPKYTHKIHYFDNKIILLDEGNEGTSDQNDKLIMWEGRNSTLVSLFPFQENYQNTLGDIHFAFLYNEWVDKKIKSKNLYIFNDGEIIKLAGSDYNTYLVQNEDLISWVNLKYVNNRIQQLTGEVYSYCFKGHCIDKEVLKLSRVKIWAALGADVINCEVNNILPGTYNVSIVDVSGRVVGNYFVDVRQGYNLFKFPSYYLSSGIYCVTFYSNTTFTTNKILISH